MITIPSGYIGFILSFIFIFIIILPLVSFLVARKIIDKKQSDSKSNREQPLFFKGLFSFQNFPIAVVFVVFSPALIFFMLWAVSFLSLGWRMLFVVVFYFLIQISTLVYILCKGGFEWKR